MSQIRDRKPVSDTLDPVTHAVMTAIYAQEVSLRSMSVDLGVSIPAIRNWAKGRTSPSVLMLSKLADYAGVEIIVRPKLVAVREDHRLTGAKKDVAVLVDDDDYEGRFRRAVVARLKRKADHWAAQGYPSLPTQKPRARAQEVSQ